MGTTSFGFTYDWPAIAQNLTAVSGRVSWSTPSAHVGDDAGVPLASGGGLVDVAPISSEWQAVVDNVVAEMTVRDRDLTDYLNAWLQPSLMVGNLSATGTTSAPHGVNGAPSRVLWVGAFYQGAGGEAKPLTVVSVDGSRVNVSGGTAGAAYRITMIYSTVPSGW